MDLKRKTKADLLSIIVEQVKKIDSYKLVIDEQNKMIDEIKSFQVNVENEMRDKMSTDNHYNKVFNSLSVSEKRLKLAFDSLVPSFTNGDFNNVYELVDEEQKQLAKNVITNELTKIAKQQKAEADVKFTVR